MERVLEDLLGRMAAFGSTAKGPVLSLYLNLEPHERGRPRFERFLRKELKKRATVFPLHSPERDAIEKDASRVWSYLREDRDPASRSAILFACDAEGLFEAVQTAVPLDQHHLFVGDRPELFHLARLATRQPPCAALVADAQAARILVISLGEVVDRDVVETEKTSRTTGGGWSQMRYQRHVDNVRLHHAREIVEHLDRVVERDDVQSVVLAGDDQVVAMLRKELPPHLEERVVDDVRLDFLASDRHVLERTLESVRARDAADDTAAVEHLIDAYQSEGLAVAGATEVGEALERGQADELLLTSSLEELEDPFAEDGGPEDSRESSAPLRRDPPEAARTWLAADLVAEARRTGAHIRLIEDPALLRPLGGVGATLRFRL